MHKNFKYLVGLFLLLPLFYSTQAQAPFTLELRAKTITGMPGLQSFVHAEHNGKWLLIGGRTDGLHLRRPFEAFLAEDNNKFIYVVDPATEQVWSDTIGALPTQLWEQLQSTNMSFEQWGNTLYIVGGYGYSPTSQDHITYPYLTAVDVPGVVDAIVNGTSIAPHFRYVADNRMRVTGSYLDRIDSTFYLVGGQNFEGRYNPMGPTHGPGFFQEYTNEIRKFQIVDNGTTLSVSNYTAIRDTMELHRRDYNMTPQIFPNGTEGLTAFSGVFQHGPDLPWLNCVDIDASGYYPVSNFNQYLSQYHSANMPLYDSVANEMHTVFFGGMSRYTLDTTTGSLIDDTNVPFVKTISRITRDAAGTMTETRMPIDMPGYLGSSAEFLLDQNVPSYDSDIIKLDQLASGDVRLGYIVGGIESTAPNIFFVNDGSQSWSSTTVYEVWKVDGGTAREENPVQFEPVKMSLYPVPTSGTLHIELQSKVSTKFTLDVVDVQGKKVATIGEGRIQAGTKSMHWDTTEVEAGIYFLRLRTASLVQTEKIVIE